MHQIVCQLRLRPKPHGELTSLDTLAAFRGRTVKRRRGRERKGKEGEGMEALRVIRKGGEKGEGKGKDER